MPTLKKIAKEISKEILKAKKIKVDDLKKSNEVVIECPECKKHGRSGTLDVLSEFDKKKLIELSGKDNYPDIIFGCDECKYWCDAKEVNNQ